MFYSFLLFQVLLRALIYFFKSFFRWSVHNAVTKKKEKDKKNLNKRFIKTNRAIFVIWVLFY